MKTMEKNKKDYSFCFFETKETFFSLSFFFGRKKK